MNKRIACFLVFLLMVVFFVLPVYSANIPSVKELTSLLKTSVNLAQAGDLAQWEKTLSRSYYTGMRAGAVSMKTDFLETVAKGYGRYYSALLEPVKFFKSLEYDGDVFLLGEEYIEGGEKYLIIYRFLDESGWKIDDRARILFSEIVGIEQKISANDYSFFETLWKDRNPLLPEPKVWPEITVPDYVARYGITAYGCTVVMEVNGLAHKPVHNSSTHSYIIGGLSKGENQLRFTFVPDEQAEIVLPVSLEIYAGPDTDNLKKVLEKKIEPTDLPYEIREKIVLN